MCLPIRTHRELSGSAHYSIHEYREKSHVDTDYRWNAREYRVRESCRNKKYYPTRLGDLDEQANDDDDYRQLPYYSVYLLVARYVLINLYLLFTQHRLTLWDMHNCHG